ncbi:hypothetical protein [Streptomyces katrae]|uniref:hypothetical protein n=1 Tax=Streptomyces katrae TaxID=68223 RepID=UPI0004C173AB|nr:hypothetical protein [Streptomyces katrae]
MRVPLPPPRSAAGLLPLLGFLLTGCSAAAPVPAPDEVINAATQALTDACLTRQGLTPPRRGQSPPPAHEQQITSALFGNGPTELSLTLPTGYVVRAHTDGCLGAAQQRLYGDQRRWFRVSVIVNNLEAEASHTQRPLSEVRDRHRADLADWHRMRTRALSEATTVLNHPSSQGDMPR